jgi:hypothetical protein
LPKRIFLFSDDMQWCRQHSEQIGLVAWSRPVARHQT